MYIHVCLYMYTGMYVYFPPSLPPSPSSPLSLSLSFPVSRSRPSSLGVGIHSSYWLSANERVCGTQERWGHLLHEFCITAGIYQCSLSLYYIHTYTFIYTYIYVDTNILLVVPCCYWCKYIYIVLSTAVCINYKMYTLYVLLHTCVSLHVLRNSNHFCFYSFIFILLFSLFLTPFHSPLPPPSLPPSLSPSLSSCIPFLLFGVVYSQ